MKNLLREFVRAVIAEVDVLPPERDPRLGGSDHDPAKPADDPTKKSKPGAPQQKPGQGEDQEKVRNKVQDVIKRKVQGGSFATDDDLQHYLTDPAKVKADGKMDDSDDDVTLALNALHAVPVSVWKNLR